MMKNLLSGEQVAQISNLVASYIQAQREKYAPQAAKLSSKQSARLSGFFLPELLESVRVVTLGDERIENPDFYPMLKSLGFRNLPSQSSAAAVTFHDVVVSHEPFSDGLLFHELVHVEQYRQLGIAGFSELYVRGFLNGGSYDAIPLELNAYSLGGQFEANPTRHFSVSEEVGRCVLERKF